MVETQDVHSISQATLNAWDTDVIIARFEGKSNIDKYKPIWMLQLIVGAKTVLEFMRHLQGFIARTFELRQT